MSWIDRAIEFVSPRRAFDRAYYRAALNASRTGESARRKLDAISANRLRGEWAMQQVDADLSNVDRRKLNNVVRQLCFNNPYAAGAVGRVVDNVVGRGIKPQCALKADTAETEPMRKPSGWVPISEQTVQRFQAESEALWAEFAESADVSEHCDYYQIQALAERGEAMDGETLYAFPRLDDPERPSPFGVELIESERIGTPPGELVNRAYRDGVEIDPTTGAPVAYHVQEAPSAQGMPTWEYRRLPRKADSGQVLALLDFERLRPGQYRGISPFAPSLGVFEDLHRYWEAEIVAARVSACYSAFITSPTSRVMQANSGSANEAGNLQQRFTPGLIQYLQPGEEVSFGNPTRPNGAFGPFTEILLRAIGVAWGLPFELIALDFSKTNYSSARAAMLEARRVFRRRQGRHVAVGKLVWAQVIRAGVASGRLYAPGFAARWRDYCASHWTPPAWGWVDPVKEETAARDSIAGYLSTFEEELAARGMDPDQVLDSAVRFHTRLKKEGLPSPWDGAAPTPDRPSGSEVVAQQEIADGLTQ